MKAEEASRYLTYLGCEANDLDLESRPRHLWTKYLLGPMAVLCVVILVGMTVYVLATGEASVAEAQPQESISKDIPVPQPPLDMSGSFDTSQGNAGTGGWGYNGQHFSYECVGPWYPILVGLLACPGG